MFQFDKGQYYKLIAVTDENGVDKVYTRELYKERINCIATSFHFDKYPEYQGMHRLRMTFIQTGDGQWCRRHLHTSVVRMVEETAKGFNVHTYNSVYVFERAEIKEVPHKEAADLIELYMSYEDSYYFGKGFYYDSKKEIHELRIYIHDGWFQDSVLLFLDDGLKSNCVCRYFPNTKIELNAKIKFYDTLYGQQDYSIPMLIHNTGKRELTIGFQRYPHEWKIEPGTSKYIVPYQAELEQEDNV